MTRWRLALSLLTASILSFTDTALAASCRYMALINPFRNPIVYPSLLRSVGATRSEPSARPNERANLWSQKRIICCNDYPHDASKRQEAKKRPWPLCFPSCKSFGGIRSISNAAGAGSHFRKLRTRRYTGFRSFSRPESTASGVRRTNSGFFVEMVHRKKLGLCIGCGSEVRNEGEH